MDEKSTENVNSKNDTEEVVTSEEKTTEEPKGDSKETDALKKAEDKIIALKKENKGLKEESKPKASEEVVEEKPKAEVGELSQTDMYVLLQANVHKDDLEEVRDYAKYKGISATEALETGHIKSFLQERSEERATAKATETGKGAKGALAKSDEALWETGRQGKETDPEKMAQARDAIVRKKTKERREFSG